MLFLSCNNSVDENILTQAPYDKITDSIHRSSANPDLYYRRGAMLYSNNLLLYAEGDLRHAWQLQHREDYALSLVTLLKQKNPDSAIVFIQQAIRSLPSSIALKIALARGYQQKNQLEKAMAVCDSIITLCPNQLDALVLKSDLLKSSNKKTEALQVLEKAYSYAPLDRELSYNLAYDYADAKDPRAVLLSDKLIRLDSSEMVARAYYIKGIYFDNTGQPELAIRNFNAAIARDYTFMDAYRDKGELLYHLKKYNDALKVFELALKVSPAIPEFYFWEGRIQEALGNKQEAKLNYLKAYGLDKSMTEAKDAAGKL